MSRAKHRRSASLGALFLLTLLLTVLYIFMTNTSSEYSLERIRIITNHTAGLFEDWLANYTDAAELTAAVGQIVLHDTTKMPTLQGVVPNSVLGQHLAVMGMDDKLYLTNPKGVFQLAPQGNPYTQWQKAFANARQHPAFAGSVPAFFRQGEEFLVLHPFLDANGTPNTLALRIPLRALTKKLGKFASQVPDDRKIFVVSNNGMLLAPLKDGKIRKLSEDPVLAPLAASLALPPSKAQSHVQLDDTSYLAAQAPITGTEWRVILISPTTNELQIIFILRIVLIGTWLAFAGFILCLFFQSGKNDHYRTLSELDHLTGTGNRLAFEKAFNRLQSNNKFPVSLLMMDVDGLKILNDTFGHEAGDALLRRFTLLLQRSLRDHDRVYRIGGDEFAVIIPDMTQTAAAVLVERITMNANHMREKTSLPPLYFSHGLAEAHSLDELATIYRRADEAMYAEKNARRKHSNQKIHAWSTQNASPERRHRAANSKIYS